jgi:hypothetical protein
LIIWPASFWGKNIELGVFIGIVLRLDSPLQSICCVSGTKRALVLSFLGLGKSGFKAEEKISEVHLNLSRAIIEERIFLSGYCTVVERQERKSRRPFQIRGGLSKLPRLLLLNFYSVINRDPGKGLRLKFCRCVNQYKRYPPRHNLRTIETAKHALTGRNGVQCRSVDPEPSLPPSNNSLVPTVQVILQLDQSDSKYFPIRRLLTAMKRLTARLQTVTNVFFQIPKALYLCNNGSLMSCDTVGGDPSEAVN